MMNDPQEPNRHPLEEQPARKRHPLEEGPPQRPAQQGSQGPRARIKMPIVRPLVTYALLAVNIGVYLLGLSSTGQQFILQGSSSTYDVLVQGEYYRLFTAMFLHASIPHILFNMYALYIIGTSLEPVFGNIRFAIIYLLGGLTGSILSVIMGSPDPSLSVGSVGASGAVFAIFGAEMIYLYRHREIMGARGQAQFRNLLFLLGLNFFIGIASGLDGARVRIDNWAHLGGLIGGLILTWFIGPVFRVMQDPQNPSQFFADDLNPAERKYWLVSVYLIVLVGVLGVVTFLVRQ